MSSTERVRAWRKRHRARNAAQSTEASRRWRRRLRTAAEVAENMTAEDIARALDNDTKEAK